MSNTIDQWTHRIVHDEISLTDVPTRERARVASEIKTYADHFPDVGVSPTVTRLVAELDAVDVRFEPSVPDMSNTVPASEDEGAR